MINDHETVGQTSSWYYVSTGELVDTDIILNSTHPFGIDFSPDKFDAESVLLHELGHALGLANLYSPSDSDKVMYGYIAKGQIKRSLHQDDINGVVYLYGEETPSLSQVYRFWSDVNRTHFFTISESEKNYIINNYPSYEWRYEGVAFKAFKSNIGGTMPVHRFWSNTYRRHFYTISEEEKNFVITQWPHIWKYEGIAWYAYPNQIPGTVPVYRFWSDTNKAHFYTISEEEKNYIIRTYPPHEWRYEGIAWYVFP